VANATIRAPVSGSVVGLSVFSAGSVIGPGQRLMEIVPDAAPLVVEARLSPNDIADVSLGQEAQIRLFALHDRTLPILMGKVTQVSADAFNDERTGARYFTVEVTVPVNQVIALRKAEGKTSGIRPGLPVQVMISLRKRTALEYLLEPLTQSMWTSLHEH
jgi:HlyD family secretion protein